MFISPAEYAATVEKIAKINARAAKRGFTGSLEVVATPTTRERTVNGFHVVEEGFEFDRIGGTAPSYNGWTLLAVLDYDQHAGLVTRVVPGAETTVNRETLVQGWCDHCKTDRQRNRTFVVVNADGEQVQVGSTCIKDFLGWSASVVFFTTDEFGGENDSLGFGGFGGGPRSYSTDTVLTIAWAAIKSEGWKPASFERPTRNLVSLVLEGPSPYSKGRALEEDRARIAAVQALAPQAAGRGAEVLAFLRSDAFKGDSDYVVNLKVVAAAEFVSERNLGLLVSAHQAFARHQERSLVAAKAEALPASEHFGQVGDKVTFTGQITVIRYIHGQYGTTVLYIIRNQETGVEVKWFASREALGENTGVEVTITGTVKGHDDYQGRKATVLTRCKPITATTAA